MLRELWGICPFPVVAPHRHIAWGSDGAFLCLLTGLWMSESMIAVNGSAEKILEAAAHSKPVAASSRDSARWN